MAGLHRAKTSLTKNKTPAFRIPAGFKALFAGLAIGVFASLPSAGQAQVSGPGLETVLGTYAPDGDCSQWPQMTVEPSQIRFTRGTSDDLLQLYFWHPCPDCLPGPPPAAGELRMTPTIDLNDPNAGPVFRFNPDGVAATVIAEPRGDMSGFDQLAAVVEYGVLTNCAVSQIEVAARLAPSADEQWYRFDTGSRAGGYYCPLRDPSGGHQLCLNAGCEFGRPMDWELTVAGAPGGFNPAPADPIRAEILIDDAVVARMTFTPSAGAAGTLRARFDTDLHPRTIVQLRQGTQAELRLAQDRQSVGFQMGLRGSSRALDRIVQMCFERLSGANPLNRRDRFIMATGPSQPDAERFAREALAPLLAEMNTQANPPIVDVQTAWLIDLGDGWRFILTDVGPSTAHFGIGAYATFVFAAPPGEPFRRVGPDANAGQIWLDTEERNQGWPRLLFQSVRGTARPFHAWRWDGQAYVYEREIRP